MSIVHDATRPTFSLLSELDAEVMRQKLYVISTMTLDGVSFVIDEPRITKRHT